jgi:NADP-dependent 3-hydroxy acid dehydrogenase YdfG
MWPAKFGQFLKFLGGQPSLNDPNLVLPAKPASGSLWATEKAMCKALTAPMARGSPSRRIVSERLSRHDAADRVREDDVLGRKVAWVTGAGSGIGRAGALELAKAGAQVVLSGRRAAQLDEVVAEVEAAGGKAEAVALDVADKSAVAGAAAQILARRGAVDILVNSAGINLPNRFWKNLTPESFSQIVAVNLNGALYCTHAVLPAMRARRDGLVINISSWAGRFETYATGPAYNASKHAMAALTLSLNDEECVNGIRACVIYPGEVATPILKHRPKPPSPDEIARMLQPEDLGRTIRFVAEMPAHVCINEILISPTWNRLFVGGADIARG